MLGNGNNPLPVCHNAVIQLFNAPGAEAVGSVKSRHKMNAGAFGCPISAPGRRTGTGMNDVNAVVTDKLFQLFGVSPHFENIFAFQRQGEMRHFGLFQIINHTSALRGDKIFNFVLLHVSGDFYRAALNAAHFQLRQNL